MGGDKIVRLQEHLDREIAVGGGHDDTRPRIALAEASCRQSGQLLVVGYPAWSSPPYWLTWKRASAWSWMRSMGRWSAWVASMG